MMKLLRQRWLLLGLLAGLGWLGWSRLVAPMVEARSFADRLYGFEGMSADPKAAPGELHLTGKTLMMVPSTVFNKPAIYSGWNRLPSRIRARTPDEVSTVIYVRLNRGVDTARYKAEGGLRERAAVSGVVQIEVYDWPSRSYVGSHEFRSGGPGLQEKLTERDIETMEEALSPKVIAGFVATLPVHK